MLWPQEAAELASFWPSPALSHMFWYSASAALACVGYGSIFLAAGLLLRNPIIPAVVILFWENINNFLPCHAAEAQRAPLRAGPGLPCRHPPTPAPPMIIQLLIAPGRAAFDPDRGSRVDSR